MPHKKSTYAIQRREAARIVSQAAIKDPSIRETINVLTPGRIAVFLQNRFDRFELGVINRYNVGEVLSDSIGRGTLQRVEALE
jgi:hypothetical protein